MDNQAYIEIRVSGKKGNIELSPDNYDIKEIITVLQAAENLLFPSNKKDRPLVSYNIEKGSVKHVIKTSVQAVIGFNAIIGQVNATNSIDFLELQSAKALEVFQESAIKKDVVIEIETSVPNAISLKIDKDSKYFRAENIWVDAEFYFYGTLTNAGGKNRSNIHLDTEDYGSLTILADRDYLQQKEDNFLYKKFGVRAIGKQSLDTGEFDKHSLKLIELIDYHTKYDESYLSSLMKKASSSWKDISDPDDWLNQLRGSYDA